MPQLLGIPTILSIGIPYGLHAIIGAMGKTIGERLKLAREELQRSEGKKPNQAAFAREIGIRPASLSELESGESGAPRPAGFSVRAK